MRTAKLFVAFLVVLTATMAIAAEVQIIPSAINNNLSGDHRPTSPDGEWMQFLRVGQWHLRSLSDGDDVRVPINRVMNGDTNDELMWGPKGDLYWVDSRHLCQGRVSGGSLRVISRTQLPDIEVRKWIAGSASCYPIQFVRGWADQGDFIQPFDAKTGELLPGWWAADASGGEASGVRNCVAFAGGFLISHRGPLAYRECWYSVDGRKSVVPLEPAGEGGRNWWSHQATFGNRLTYCYPFFGRLETLEWSYGEEMPLPTIVADKEKLRAIAGTDTYTAWQHGSADASQVVFSMMVSPKGQPTMFKGIYLLDLESHDIEEVWLAPQYTELPSTFADMPRPAFGAGWACWQHDADNDGETDLHYVRIGDDETDTGLEDLERRVADLEEGFDQLKVYLREIP